MDMDIFHAQDEIRTEKDSVCLPCWNRPTQQFRSTSWTWPLGSSWKWPHPSCLCPRWRCCERPSIRSHSCPRNRCCQCRTCTWRRTWRGYPKSKPLFWNEKTFDNRVTQQQQDRWGESSQLKDKRRCASGQLLGAATPLPINMLPGLRHAQLSSVAGEFF